MVAVALELVPMVRRSWAVPKTTFNMLIERRHVCKVGTVLRGFRDTSLDPVGAGSPTGLSSALLYHTPQWHEQAAPTSSITPLHVCAPTKSAVSMSTKAPAMGVPMRKASAHANQDMPMRVPKYAMSGQTLGKTVGGSATMAPEKKPAKQFVS